MGDITHWRQERANTSRKSILCILLIFAPLLGLYFLLFGNEIWIGSTCSFEQGVMLFLGWNIYCARVIYSLYGLLPRSCPWGEVLTVPLFLYVIEVLTIISAAKHSWEPNWILDGFGIVLYFLGSFFNTWSEQTRAWWKKKPENKGKLYTEGLFGFVRHPNYLGDLILFSGLMIITRVIWNIWVPIVMLLGFIFAHIPDNEGYLSTRYKNYWPNYVKQTPYKLIPILY